MNPHILSTEFLVQSSNDLAIAVSLQGVFVLVFRFDLLVVVDFTIGGKGNRFLSLLLQDKGLVAVVTQVTDRESFMTYYVPYTGFYFLNSKINIFVTQIEARLKYFFFFSELCFSYVKFNA